jgi:hypothetical protein
MIKQAIVRFGLYGGIVEKQGIAYVPSLAKETPQRNPNASIIDELEKEQQYIVPSLTPANSTPEDYILEGKSQFELRSIAKTMGIATEKTDKKPDLIAKIEAQS